MADDRPRAPSRASAAPRRSSAGQAVRDIAIAGAVVALVIGSIFVYSGTWPPMVVIESGSMMHASDSAIGVIDTGDLTLVKKVNRAETIVTYFEGAKTGYKTYGAFGDVLIYSKNGHRELTPIIHRAITWMELNATTESTWDFPDLTPPRYNLAVNLSGSATHLDLGPIWTWDLAHPGGGEVVWTVDLTKIVQAMHPFLHSGFITKGDHNDKTDQGDLRGGLGSPPPAYDPNGRNEVHIVKFEWVVGKAEGELPWFGVIKLWASGNAPAEGMPGNSQLYLVLSIVVIAVGPFAAEEAWRRWGDRVTDRIPRRWRERWHGLWDKFPGAEGRRERRLDLAREREERKRSGGRRHGGRAR